MKLNKHKLNDTTLLYSEANFSKGYIETLTQQQINEVLKAMTEFREQKLKWLEGFKKNK